MSNNRTEETCIEKPPAKRKTFSYISRTNDEPIKVPEKYDRIDVSKIHDIELPADSFGYTIATENATGIVLCFPVSKDSAMDFEKPDELVAYLHVSMNESRGIIEVCNGTCKNGGKYISYLLKYYRYKDESKGVGYQLNFNFMIGDLIYFISGSFDEAGITGMRDSIVFSNILKAKQDAGEEVNIEEFLTTEWSCDPYDPSFRQGFFMNLSEKEEFDKLLPNHPLSVARAFIEYVVSNN